MLLAMPSRTLDAGSDRIGRLLAGAIDEIAGTMTSTRELVNELRPQALDELGLVAALHVLSEEFARQSGVATEVQAEGQAGTLRELDASVLETLYRIAHSALSTIVTDASAKTSIHLACAENGHLTFTITDDESGPARPDARRPTRGVCTR
jgi:signal transduction histidine kinase